MTLTVCVGSSGSGKTTFLEDVHKSHKCTYIRQYHNMRPYIVVTKIPNFDPSRLPYWEIYENEGIAKSIKVGGTMAGEFTAGLSGGQRKLLLFELIYQRTKDQNDLLLVLDEPFAGVTDDFIPFIVERLNLMRLKHNILLVTNDHVATLAEMSDNIIRVSAIDRSRVTINKDRQVDRSKAILALSLGDEYHYKATNDDLKFFFEVEIYWNSALLGIVGFVLFCFTLFLVTFWDSSPENAGLVLVAGSIVAYFGVNPYLLALVAWRTAMREEAEALMHASKGLNTALKAALTVLIILAISLIEYGIVNAVMDGFGSIRFWVAMLCDSVSVTFPLIALGLYTSLPFQAVEVFGSIPFLLMIFLSTTFSPGSGVAVLKEFRYTFSRFYFWCMIPGIQDDMEGCPAEALNFALLILTGVMGIFLFAAYYIAIRCWSSRKQMKKANKLRQSLMDAEFHELQTVLYGEKAMRRYRNAEMDNTSMVPQADHSSSTSDAEAFSPPGVARISESPDGELEEFAV